MYYYFDKTSGEYSGCGNEAVAPNGCEARTTPPSLAPKTTDEAKAKKLSELAAYRYGVETGGIELNGVAVLTDRESQATLTGVYVTALINPNIVIDWKGADEWIKINKAQVEAVAQVVSTHVQTCFSNERTHAEAISALATVEEIIAYDIKTGWPETAATQA